MLTLRAQRWVSEGGQVVILNMRHGSLGLPLGHLLQKQVCVLSVALLVLMEFVVGTDGVCARNWPAKETGVHVYCLCHCGCVVKLIVCFCACSWPAKEVGVHACGVVPIEFMPVTHLLRKQVYRCIVCVCVW